MELSRRKEELRKTYESFVDEILIEIAQNVNQEYEDYAAEIAKIELSKRGIEVSYDSDEKIDQDHEDDYDEGRGKKRSFNRLKKKLSGPSVEIPRFPHEESLDIDEIFVENNIPYEKRTVTTAVGPEGGRHEYVFHVSKDAFPTAIQLLKEYFGIGIKERSTGTYSGKCPACGTELRNVKECTECELTLAGDHLAFLENHPFVIFLKHHHLLFS